ncbi:MAG: FdhF/YdeP family oxidoreductase [Pyrinomonadaceae bacterium]
MSEENKQAPTQVEGANEAANQADNVHPSHYHPAKAIRSDEELGHDSSPNGDRNGSTNAPDNIHGMPAPRAGTPEEFTGLRVGAPKTAAAGIPAVMSSLKHVFGEAGVVRGLRVLGKLNQKGGIDCMSCAWPDPDGHRSSIAEYCENGAKAVASEATTKRVTPEFFKKWSVADLSYKSDYWLDQQGRLAHPMVLRRGATHYEPIAWEDAFALVAEEINKLASPDEAIFYTSGRASNEVAFLYQLFVRQLGTNNLPDCSNMCHESSGTALTETIGVGKGTVKLDDFEKAGAIFIIGQNPGTNHPRMLTTLQAAKRKGVTIVSINPLRETGLISFNHPQEVSGVLGSVTGTGTKLTDLFLQIRINGDMATLKGIMKELLEEEARRPGEVLDHEFIMQDTAGFAQFKEALEKVSWDNITEQSGVTREEIRAAAEVVMKSKRIIACWAMGLTQHKNAVGTIQEIVNLLLMRGCMGKEGAGVCPLRGHSNVQGDRTMGIWERPREEFLNSLGKEFNFEPPRKHGFDTVEAIKAMHSRKGKVLFALGGNFLSATPDTEYTAQALRNMNLTAHVATKLNRAHLITGEQALILPCLGRTEIDLQAEGEQFITTENSMGVVQMSKGILKPGSSELKSETAIIAGLARATLGNRTTVDWEALAANYDRIRDCIARVIPGCDDYNARVRQSGGFYLPNAARDGVYKTATNRANFTVHELPIHSIPDNRWVLTTVRSHDQYNTTIYGLHDRYRGIHNERRVIFLNAEDIAAAGLYNGQIVDLTSHYEAKERIARHFIIVPFDIPRRCAAAYFPETNVLVPIESVADGSNTPTSKFIIISIAPAADQTTKFDYDHVEGKAHAMTT